MTDRLFSRGLRHYDGPKPQAEPSYPFYDRSNWPEIARFRETVEAWFSRYPEAHGREFLPRFRSPDNSSFRAAFLELCLHEQCLALGYEVEVHPEVPGTTKRPEFRLSRDGVPECYLEVTLATEETPDQARAGKLLRPLLDALDRISSPNFYLTLICDGAPSRALPETRLVREVVSWLDSLDPDEALRIQDSEGFEALPSRKLEIEGARLELTAIPRRPDLRGRPGRVVAASMGDTRMVDNRSSIRRAVRKKATRYGRPDLPYLVAVGVHGDFARLEDFGEALFGTEVRWCGPDGDSRPGRARDGAWFGPKGPRNTRLRGVLALPNLAPGNLAKAEARLFLNPWAKPAYSGLLERFPTARVVADRLLVAPGLRPGEVLGLPDSWPYS